MSTRAKYRIKELIEQKFHTRAERADIRVKICMAVPVRIENLSKWENVAEDSKNYDIGICKLQKVADVLGVTINELLQPVTKTNQ